MNGENEPWTKEATLEIARVWLENIDDQRKAVTALINAINSGEGDLLQLYQVAEQFEDDALFSSERFARYIYRSEYGKLWDQK